MRCYGNDNSCAVFVMTLGSKVCVHLYWQLDIGDCMASSKIWPPQSSKQFYVGTMRFPRWTLIKQLTKLVRQRAQKRFQTALPCQIRIRQQKPSQHVRDRSTRGHCASCTIMPHHMTLRGSKYQRVSYKSWTSVLDRSTAIYKKSRTANAFGGWIHRAQRYVY